MHQGHEGPTIHLHLLVTLLVPPGGDQGTVVVTLPELNIEKKLEVGAWG